MTFSKQKLNQLRPQKSRAASTFFIALLMAAAMFLPYIVLDSGYFLFYGDFNVQQIPFYTHAHDLVKSGSLGWDFGTDLGVNFIGSYTFYLLGSPFFWITLLFPNSAVPYLIGPLLMLKFALCALTAYMYLSRFLKSNETARLGGILYAFSGFSVYNIFFNHFHEALIVFPLLLLSVELLMTENRRGLFAFCVFLAAVSNYFFFFGMVVFIIIYWFVRVFSGAIRVTVGRFFTLVFEAVLGVLGAAVLLLPTVLALSGNSRLTELQSGWGALLYGKEQIYANIIQCFFFPPDLPARPVFFPGADVKWSSLGGWLPIFSMVGVWAFMSQKKGHWLKRVIGILIFMAMVPLFNSAFYMFNTAYYARWYYMPVLMMCLATCSAIEDREIEWKNAFRWVFGITLAITLVIGFMPASFDEDGSVTRFGIYTDDSEGVYKGRFFAWCAIAIIGLLILKVLLSKKRESQKFFLRGATVCVCIMSVIYGSVFVGLGKTHSYDVDDVMIDALLQNTVELPEDSDGFRVDCYECVDNTGMYLGYGSINAFHSIVPTSVTEFWEFVGEDRGVASRPSTKSYAARSLLSVKYLFDLQDSKNFREEGRSQMAGFTYYDTQSGYDIYENENYIPYGFTYDYYITREECQHFGESSASNMMLKAMVLEYDSIYKYSNVLKRYTDYYDLDGDSDYKQAADVSTTSYFEDCAERKATAAYYFKTDSNGFVSKIVLPKENLVFYSVPYDEGWTAYVNGKKTEIVKANVGFMAVLAPEGDCEIRFEYETPGLMLGFAVSVVSFAVFAIYLFVTRIYFKRRPSKSEYPEGDKLLERWRAYDTQDALAETENLTEEEDDDDGEPPHFTDNFPDGFKIV